ncbi:hypothetical protein [Amycolatopsis anabasis]|uniref:hypothetical protein n=1 Tax=Amycolatopsis anabasis TaxID=1840409 RepID=UPI0015D45820|nr:hypothetical protein [Amycolatopsis anabasis]
MVKGRRIMLAAILGGGLVVLPAQAQAQEVVSTAEGSLGSARITVGGQTVAAEPIAACKVGGTLKGTSSGVSVGTTTEYGKGETTCTRDDKGVSTATASGKRFETRVLRQFGGPIIRVQTYGASCATTENGSSGSIQLGAVSGVQIPQEIPANHTVTIPGRQAGDPPMAEVVLNELIAPNPPDGSLITNAMHIKLFPRGGPAEGDIFVGTAGCDPYGG